MGIILQKTAGGERMRVLIIEDEKNLAETLADIVRREKYEPTVANDGQKGLEEALSGIYDVALVDVMLPYVNGFDIVAIMRKEKVATPVIMLTAKRETSDKVAGLDSGADYYLTKPFETQELLACMRAVTRRGAGVLADTMDFGDIKLNLNTNTLCCESKSIELRKKEFDVMKLLLANKDVIVSKETMLLKIWGYETDMEYNNVEVYVSFLRKKLAFLGSRVEITAVRNVGYRLEERADD